MSWNKHLNLLSVLAIASITVSSSPSLSVLTFLISKDFEDTQTVLEESFSESADRAGQRKTGTRQARHAQRPAVEH